MKEFQQQIKNYLQGDLTNNTSNSFSSSDIAIDISGENPLEYQQDHEPTIMIDVPNNSFTVEALKEHIKRKNFENFQKQLNREYKNLAITDLNTCIRQVFFRWTHAPCDIDRFVGYLYSSMMADAGTSVHKYLQSVFPFKLSETWLTNKDPFIKGRIDGYFNAEVIEIKTIKSNVYYDSNFTWRQEDLNQLSICSYLFKQEYHQPITKIKLLYVPRSLDDFRIFEFEYDNKVEEVAKTKINFGVEFFGYYRKNEVPSIASSYINMDQCRFCGYEKTICNPTKCVNELSSVKGQQENIEAQKENKNKLIDKPKQSKKTPPKIVDLN